MAQRLSFGALGHLDVENSWPSLGLHKTSDGGFYYRPGEPLKDRAVCETLPEPAKSEALAWIDKQEAGEVEKEEEKDEDKEESDKDED